MPPKLHIARRMAGIAPFQVMELVARAQALEAEGRDIIHMEVGEPDFGTPGPILDAGRRALEAGRTRYTAAAGIPELRAGIARYYEERYGVSLSADRIVVTPGASGALQLAMSMIVDPGDRVLIPDPSYPCNRHFVHYVGGEPVPIPVGPDSDYQLNSELIDRHWDERTVAVMLASPSNPTGTLLETGHLREIIALVHERGARVIMDEIYHGLVYEGETPSALSISEDVLVVNSFSKYFGMTGWRLGWLVASLPYAREAEKLAQNLFLAPPTVAQYAALEAFTKETLEICEARREEFARRRDYLVPALRTLGLSIHVVPRGAFYVYADCSRLGEDSRILATRALEEVGVAITPGHDFGDRQPEHHIRFAYTTSVEALEEGVRRLAGII